MSNVNTKMTAIADEIRELSGTIDKLSLDSMASNLSDVCEEVDTQADLISQITTALEGKASASLELQNKTVTPSTETQTITADNGYDGLKRVTVEGDVNLKAENIKNGVSIFGVEGSAIGGSSINKIDVCNVTMQFFNNAGLITYSAYENDTVIAKTTSATPNTPAVLANIICGSAISFFNAYDFNGFSHSHDSKYIDRYTHHMYVLSAPTTPNVNATISVYDDD